MTQDSPKRWFTGRELLERWGLNPAQLSFCMQVGLQPYLFKDSEQAPLLVVDPEGITDDQQESALFQLMSLGNRRHETTPPRRFAGSRVQLIPSPKFHAMSYRGASSDQADHLALIAEHMECWFIAADVYAFEEEYGLGTGSFPPREDDGTCGTEISGEPPMLPQVLSRGEGGPKTAASDTCSENKDHTDPTFDSEYARQCTEKWTRNGVPARPRLKISNLWHMLTFDAFWGHGNLDQVTKLVHGTRGDPNLLPQWLRTCLQQELVHLWCATKGLRLYRPGKLEPFQWWLNDIPYREYWQGLEDCLISKDDLRVFLKKQGLPLPRFWFPEESGDPREQELEAKPAEWITGAELVKRRKKPDNLYELVVSGKTIPWTEVPPLLVDWETKSPVRRERHRRLLPSYVADEKAKQINGLAFQIQSSERWLAQSDEEHCASFLEHGAGERKEPGSLDSLREYMSTRRREHVEKLPAMRADLDRLVKELDPATVWKTEFARLYSGGVPTSVKKDWLEKFMAASYEDPTALDQDSPKTRSGDLENWKAFEARVKLIVENAGKNELTIPTAEKIAGDEDLLTSVWGKRGKRPAQATREDHIHRMNLDLPSGRPKKN